MTGYSVRIGDAEIVSVTDGHIHFAPSDFFPSVDSGEWAAHSDQLTADGLIRMNVGSFVIRVGDDVALVDTGLGEGDHPFDNSEWGLLASDMAGKGITPDEVTTVIITHLHRDHVGWNMVEKNGARTPFFPNAKYHIPKADWDVFTRRAGMRMFSYINEQVTPLMELGALEFVKGEQSISDNLTALPTPRATPPAIRACLYLRRARARSCLATPPTYPCRHTIRTGARGRTPIQNCPDSIAPNCSTAWNATIPLSCPDTFRFRDSAGSCASRNDATGRPSSAVSI